MAIMSRLLDKIKPKTLAEQLAELDKLTMVQRETVAMSEESIELRSAAINLLDHGVTLTGLACDCTVTSLRQQARQLCRPSWLSYPSYRIGDLFGIKMIHWRDCQPLFDFSSSFIFQIRSF